MTTPQQVVSRKQERRTAATFGGRVQPGSGSGWVHRNDVRADGLLIENKTKVNPRSRSITIQSKDLEQLRINALRSKRLGVMQFDLNTRQYIIITEDDFIAMLDQQWEGPVATTSNGCCCSSPARRSGRSSTEGSAMERLALAISSSPTATMTLRALQRKLSAAVTATETSHAR